MLESLAADATARLIDALPGGEALPETVRARITTAAEGNPSRRPAHYRTWTDATNPVDNRG